MKRLIIFEYTPKYLPLTTCILTLLILGVLQATVPDILFQGPVVFSLKCHGEAVRGHGVPFTMALWHIGAAAVTASIAVLFLRRKRM